jgi:hypothetical protein
MKVFLGFDPGGEGNFGWAVCIGHDNGLKVVDAGAADHAKGALEKSLKALPKEGTIVAAGIDAPMFWVFDGSREADRRIRAVIGRLGAPAPGGTVQHFNSLRGACVIQGLLVLKLLRQSYPNLPVTEAHPKALLWLMGIARQDFGPEMVKLNDIKGIYVTRAGIWSEHERDAVLGAFTAQAMIRNESGWEDLLKFERDSVLAGKPPISYWMPKISLSG